MTLPLALRITSVNRETPDIWRFRIDPETGSGLPFIAGQVAVLEIEGVGRTYLAIASAPEDEGYEFLVRRNDSNGFTKALFASGEGERVLLKEIVGHGFPITGLAGHDLVLVAMGTGLAPLRSTLRHILLRRGEFGRLIVLYGARRAADLCFQEEMEQIWIPNGVELRRVISRPEGDEWSGPTGYVQSLLDNLVPLLSNPVALVCGSREMIEQTRERLGELGFPPAKILTNY